MKTKLIILLLLLGIILVSGCEGNNQPAPEENVTPEEVVTPEENLTPAENITPVETESEAEITPVENETNVSEIPTPTTEETAYLVRLDNYRASPSTLELEKGEAVSWMNMQEDPKRAFTLVSEQDLFDNTSLVYRRSFVYTFNETGEYTFTVVGQPKMNVTVTVVES